MDLNKIRKLLRAINTAGAITVGDSPILHSGNTTDPDGLEPADFVAEFSWHDAEGLVFEENFQACGLAEAEVKGNVITARNELGEDTEIRLFELKPLNIDL